LTAGNGWEQLGTGVLTGVAVVEVRGLSKRYGSVQALRSVDLAVERGCTGLVGSNGAGKSTLLKLLLGLIAPDTGDASVLGHDVASDPLGVRAQVGYLPEGACLPGDVTAADFVAFMGQLGGLPPRAARERAAEVCYPVGLDEERYRALGGFSTGMQQRVKLAVALVHDPALLLLDEPSEGLAPIIVQRIGELLRQLRGTGATVLIAEQNMHFCLGLASHATVIDKGQIVYTSGIEELKANDNIRQRYLAL
jgi:ABC-type multidrug transport system ATPase subunit